MRQCVRDVDLLLLVRRRRHEPAAEVGLVASIVRDSQTIHGADVDARVALDAEIRGEVCLDVAVETALHFRGGLLGSEPELDLGAEVREPLGELRVLHLTASHGAVVVAVTPRMHADLGAHEVHSVRRTVGERDAAAVIVNRDRRLMAMLDRPNDVLGSPGRVAPEEDAGARARHRAAIDDGHVVLVELDADVPLALDPREGVVLPDREHHVIARQNDGVDHLAALLSVFLEPAQPLEFHADELAVLHDEALRRVVLHDLDLLLFRVLKLPRRGFEVRARPARDDLDVLSAQAARRATTVHRRVTDADDEHAFADRFDVAEVHGRQPFDTDMNTIGVVAPRDLEVLSLGRSATDEDRVIALAEQRAHARHRRVPADFDAHVQDVLDLLVQHLGGKPERRNVHPHQSAGAIQLFVNDNVITERHQIVRDSQGCRSGANQRDPFPVLLVGRFRQEGRDVIAKIRRDALQPAYRDGLSVHARAPARGLARAVARATEDPGEDVRLPIDEVRLRVPPLRDQPDVLGDIRVGGASPLAVDNLMVVPRIGDVRRAHAVCMIARGTASGKCVESVLGGAAAHPSVSEGRRTSLRSVIPWARQA